MVKSLNDVITIYEVADALNVTTANIRIQIKNGTIPIKFYIKRKGSYIFDKEYIKYHKLNKSINKCEKK
jgi:hypothetical protein